MTVAGAAGLAAAWLDFPARAEGCGTLEELGQLTSGTAALAGMTALACGMLTGARVAEGRAIHFHTWPEAWVAHYRAGGFLDCDPLPRLALVSGAPLRWSEVLRRLAPHDPGRRIAVDAARFGFVEGVAVPVRSHGGQLGLVSLAGPGREIGEAPFHFLVAIATIALHRAEAIDTTARPEPPLLSRREQECVSLLVQGLTEHEIAAQLHIGEVTVRFHLDNAKRKTGARSRTHLAGIAGIWLGQRNHRLADPLSIER